MKCRYCKSLVEKCVIDLHHAPPSNEVVFDRFASMVFLPLRVLVCESCWMVQTQDQTSAQTLFSDTYPYFSSTSRFWLEHAKEYADMIEEKLQLDANSLVVEIASNDGYLLRNFREKGIPCFGIEPTASTASAAEALGIKVVRDFFTDRLSQSVFKTKKADLVIGNNVYAHVPDINDFTRGLYNSLNPNGTATLEFPSVKNLIENNQFDTVYHEHFSYLSLFIVKQIVESASLRVYDVEQVSSHGGSLRVYLCKKNANITTSENVNITLQGEIRVGINSLRFYENFQKRALKVKLQFLEYLTQMRHKGKKVVGFGAAAKASTILNFCGIRRDLLSYVVDSAEAKQGKLLPGSLVPIYPPEKLYEDDEVDAIVIFPWNIANEITQLIRTNCHKKVPLYCVIPELRMID